MPQDDGGVVVILNPSEARAKNLIPLLGSFVANAPPSIGPPEALRRRVNGQAQDDGGIVVIPAMPRPGLCKDRVLMIPTDPPTGGFI